MGTLEAPYVCLNHFGAAGMRASPDDVYPDGELDSFFLGELQLSEVLLYSLILFSLRASTLRLGVLDLSLAPLDAAPGPDFNTTAGGLAADFFATLALVLPLSDALPPLLLCELGGWAGSGGF